MKSRTMLILRALRWIIHRERYGVSVASGKEGDDLLREIETELEMEEQEHEGTTAGAEG